MSQLSQALTMSSSDSGQGDSICTPKRAQKSLFNKSVTSSSKRNLFQAITSVSREGGISGDESDLGPMSPLALTDLESCDSSPGRQYDSPFTTPEKSPRSPHLTWDRLRPMNRGNLGLSPFSSLRKTTREARASPRRKIFNNSPKSLPGTPERKRRDVIIPGTPEQQDQMLFTVLGVDEIVPETPQKDSITETPRKSSYSEKRLITPLGSICKSIIVPPIHRRKSLSALDSGETSSPERSSKRHAQDSITAVGSKLFKTDENSTIPKARASLFREDKVEPPKPNFTLSTKSFYNSNFDENTRHSICFGVKKSEPVMKKRHSLPLQNNRRRSGGHVKKSRFGGINAGVMHGIKRPKPKRQLPKVEALKNGESSLIVPAQAQVSKPTEIMVEARKHENNGPKVVKNNAVVKQIMKKVERPPSPVEDPNKRFFKTNRTLKAHHVATVTVNEKIKLKVSDGKIALNERKTARHVNKKPRVEELAFDTSDLTVDEPTFNSSVEQSEMAGILKVLEDDWADDEYDTMEALTNRAGSKSPRKTAARNNVLMSPASVLINMTSSMNIEDQVASKINGDTPQQPFCNENAEQQKKFFPLFSKEYRQSNIFEDLAEKKPSRGVKRGAWQLSAKASGDQKQYQLDAGQKRFGSTQCHECGVVYQMGEPEDENAHLIFHNSVKSLKFNGWKKEHIIMEDPFTGSRIITIEQSDPKHCWKKVEEILAVVDRDLGLADMQVTDYRDKTIYLYIRNKNILGVLIAENIKEAHCMIPELVELDCCSSESTPAKCGVNVIWTAMSHRRQRIASKLLDTLRTNYYYGYILSLDDIAFSMPTPTGKIFAEKYIGTRNFKVYS